MLQKQSTPSFLMNIKYCQKMIKTLSQIRQPSYELVETVPNSPQVKKIVDFELLFQNQKSNLKTILIIFSVLHLMLIIAQAMFMNQEKSRKITVYFMIQMFCEGLVIGINLLIIVLLRKQEFQNLKNNSFVQISDLESPIYLFSIFMKEFVIFSYCYKFYSLVQIEVIGFGMYLLINGIYVIYFKDINYSILIFMILSGFKLNFIICYQIFVSRNSQINYALRATQYEVSLGEELKECIICLENLKILDLINSLPCDKDHVFHSKCIELWLARTNQCPMCRKTPEYI